MAARVAGSLWRQSVTVVSSLSMNSSLVDSGSCNVVVWQLDDRSITVNTTLSALGSAYLPKTVALNKLYADGHDRARYVLFKTRPGPLLTNKTVVEGVSAALKRHGQRRAGCATVGCFGTWCRVAVLERELEQAVARRRTRGRRPAAEGGCDDWIVMLDSDAYLAEPHVSVPSFVETLERRHAPELARGRFDIALAEQEQLVTARGDRWGGKGSHNTGVLLVRATPWALSFVRRWSAAVHGECRPAKLKGAVRFHEQACTPRDCPRACVAVPPHAC